MENLRETLIMHKLLEPDYDSDSLVLGNVEPTLMVSTKRRLTTETSQNIAIVDLSDPDMIAADKSGRSDVIFEYFWGFIYRYLYSNSTLKEKYIDSPLQEKLDVFNLFLGSNIQPNSLLEKNLLFSFEPNMIVQQRENCDFKICLFNYQNITSAYLIHYINLLTRERPQITILTQECGLKDNSTGIWFTSIGADFHYYDIGNDSSVGFQLVNKKYPLLIE